MNVLVFSGSNVVQASLHHALATIESVLSAGYAVQTISELSFTTDPWQLTCRLLVFPQCRNLWTSEPTIIWTARSYVENGGVLLSLVGGADWDSNASSSVVETSEIWGSLTGHGRIRRYDLFDETTLSYNVWVPSNTDEQVSGVQALLRGEEGTGGGHILAVRCDAGAGKALLWGPRLSTPVSVHSDLSIGTKRQAIVRASLQDIGLNIPPPSASTVARPLPIFLVGSPAHPSVVHHILDAYRPVVGSEPSVHQDEDDQFTFRAYSESAEILQAGGDVPGTCSVTTAEPIHVIVCAGGELPSAEHTPQFNFQTFYQALSGERSKIGLPETLHPSGLGEVLLYGAVVKSTQTILHK
jgi:biotin--protein ligase